MLVCGDFNSLLLSAPHALLAFGKVESVHPDLSIDPLNILRPYSKLTHQPPPHFGDEDHGFNFGDDGLEDQVPVFNDEGPSQNISSSSSEGFITPRLYHDVDPLWLDLGGLFKTASSTNPKCRARKISLSMSLDEINDALGIDMEGAHKRMRKKSRYLTEPFVSFGKKKVNNESESVYNLSPKGPSVPLIQSYDENAEPFKPLSSICRSHYNRWIEDDDWFEIKFNCNCIIYLFYFFVCVTNYVCLIYFIANLLMTLNASRWINGFLKIWSLLLALLVICISMLQCITFECGGMTICILQARDTHVLHYCVDFVKNAGRKWKFVVMPEDHILLKLARGERYGHHCWRNVSILYCPVLFGKKHWILAVVELDIRESKCMILMLLVRDAMIFIVNLSPLQKWCHEYCLC